ncbi:MAG TPA: phytoene/squalene synthase family protein [Mesorhizobium sp.]
MIPDFAQSLRLDDPDRYLSVLYAPASTRGALFALYAFNAEIGSIRDRVSAPLPGEMRLQWWRDVIEAGTVEAAGGHPTATALLATIAAHNLPKAAFANMLDARVFDLYDDPMPSRTDLEGYCGETASALIQLTALVLDREGAPRIASLAGHAGCAQAIAGLLRALPLHRARGQCFIPADILAAAGTTPAEFIAGENKPAALRAVEATIALGRDHWAAFAAEASKVAPLLRSAFLPVTPAPVYFNAVERLGEGALTRAADVAGWRKQWALFRATARGW